MPRRTKKRRRPPGRYRPAPISGLLIYPTALLLNVVVTRPEDDAKTDGLIPLDTVNKATALMRHAYDFADLDREQGEGVVISLLNQFFQPDDYFEQRIAQVHVKGLMDALRGDLQPRGIESFEARPSQMSGVLGRTAADETTLPLYYKQRYLSVCFAGPKTELDKLQDDVPDDLLSHILGVLGQDLGFSDRLFILYHPAFVPVARLRQVSQENATRWAREMADWVKEGVADRFVVKGPPGPSFTIQRRNPPSAGKEP